MRIRGKKALVAVSAVMMSAGLAMPIAVADPRYSASICAETKGLVARALSNFEGEALTPLSGAETCRTARALSGAQTYHCAWKFPYRSAAASRVFDSFSRALKDCFPQEAQGAADQAVNHPDSYDLRQYMVGEVDVSVSLKDKGALQQTYVFIGVQGIVASE